MNSVVIHQGESSHSRNTVFYRAPEIVNNPDFSRYITARPVQLREAFANLPTYSPDGIMSFQITCPRKDSARDLSDVAFWFIASNFVELNKRTKQYGILWGKSIDVFNKVVLNQEGDHVVWVIKPVVEQLIKEKLRTYDRDCLLMNVNTLRLQVTPFYRQQGWNDLLRIAEYRSKAMNPNEQGACARLHVSVRVVYHEFTDRDVKKD